MWLTDDIRMPENLPLNLTKESISDLTKSNSGNNEGKITEQSRLKEDWKGHSSA